MKKFLKKSAATFLLFIAGLIVLIIITHAIVRYNTNFVLNGHKQNIIIGHSHPETAFDDSLINNTRNLSKSGEGYFYNYLKIKEVLSENDVNAIFLEYSNNQIESRMDEWIWGYEKMSAYLYRHTPFMEKKEFIFLFDNNPSDFIKIIATSTLKNLIRVLSSSYDIDKQYGSYKNLNRNNLSKELTNKLDAEKEKEKQKNISKDNINYLEKIVEYCKLKNVQIYFVRSPQHSFFPRYNEEKLFAIKNEKFNHVEFLDFDTFPLNNNEYADFGHLNNKGAKVFSQWFNMLLEQGLLSKENKKLFIEKELEKIKVQRSSLPKNKVFLKTQNK